MANNEMQIILTAQDQATGKIKRSLDSLKSSGNKTSKSLISQFTAVGLSFGAFAVAMNKALEVWDKFINASIKFESAFAGVRKTVNATESEFKQLSKELVAMSTTIPIGVEQLAKIQELAGQLGVSGVKNLSKFTNTVAKISVTTNLTEESAATSFARIANIMQENLDNVDRMGASVVELGNNYATTEAEITDFATRIAGSARVVGISTADIFGMSAAFTSVGVASERGGTATSKALIMMGEAVTKGGTKLQDFADIAGLTSEQFVQLFKNDAAKAFSLFIEGIGKKGLKGAKILDDLGLADQRLKQAFLSVGGASGIMTRAIDDSNKAFQENSALQTEAAKRFSTTESSATLLTNSVTALHIEMGTNLLGSISSVNVVLADMVNWLTKAEQESGLLSNTIKESLIGGLGAIPIPGLMGILQSLRLIKQEAEEISTTGVGGGGENPNENPEIDRQALYEAQLEEEALFWEQKAELVLAGDTLINDILRESQMLTLDEKLQNNLKFLEIEKNKIAVLLETAKLEENIEMDLLKRKAQIIEAEKKLRAKAATDNMALALAAGSSLLAQLSQTLQMAQGESQKFAGVIQAIRIGETIINTATAVMKAMAEMPYPLNFAVAAATAAMGAAQVGIIASQGFAEGTDSVPSMLTPGEMVVPRSFAGAIRNGDLVLGGRDSDKGMGGMVVNIEINNPVVSSSENIDELVEEISNRLAREAERI